MSEFLFFMLAIVIVVCVTAGSTRSKEQEEAFIVLSEVTRFVGYVEKHKDELPQNVRERFDELEEFVSNSRRKENGSR